MAGIGTYIQFLWNSTNRHGVHSPFVFSFIDRALYAKKPLLQKPDGYKFREISSKKAALLHRIIYYFNCQKLLALGDDTAAITEILRYAGEKDNRKIWFFSPIAPIPGTIDLLYLDYKNKGDLLHAFEQRLADTSNNTVCIIDNIYSSTEMETAWMVIKNHPQVTVTVDTFQIGIVFLRKGQAKQHFTVRLLQSPVLNAVLGIRNLYGLLN